MTTLSEASDTEILQQLASDLEGGLRLVLRQLVPRVRGALRHEFGPRRWPEIDDALNHAMHQLARGWREFDTGLGSLRAWIYRVARNRILDALRPARGPWRLVDADLLGQMAAAAPPSPDAATPTDARKAAAIDALARCIERLPPQQRAIVTADLRAGGSADAGELADALETTPNSIYVSRHKARRSLRRMLTEEGFG